MAANIDDLITQATNGTRPEPTALTSSRNPSDPSISVDALTGWPTATAVHFIIYQKDVSNRKLPGTQTDWKGIASGTTISDLELMAGIDNGDPIGAVVEAGPTAMWANGVYEAFTAEHDKVNGSHKSLSNTGGQTNAGGLINTGGLTTDTEHVTGASTFDGAIGGAGYSVKTIKNPYVFSARQVAGLTLGGSVRTTITAYTEYFDPSTMLNATTGVFTAPIAGYYDFSGSAQSFVVPNTEGGSVLVVTRSGGGTEDYPGSFWYQNIGSAQQCNSSLSTGPILFAAGETAVFQNYASQPGTYSLSGAIFACKLVGVA